MDIEDLFTIGGAVAISGLASALIPKVRGQIINWRTDRNRKKAAIWTAVASCAGIFIQLLVMFGEDFFYAKSAELEVEHVVSEGVPCFFAIALVLTVSLDYWIERELRLQDKWKEILTYGLIPLIFLIGAIVAYFLASKSLSHRVVACALEGALILATIYFTYHAKYTFFTEIDRRASLPKKRRRRGNGSTN